MEEMPKNDNECIISKELADLNNLKVGDKIKLKSSIVSVENGEQKIKNINVELIITGYSWMLPSIYVTV